jgi:hypothetical protein
MLDMIVAIGLVQLSGPFPSFLSLKMANTPVAGRQSPSKKD